jgi:hypothetical protein
VKIFIFRFCVNSRGCARTAPVLGGRRLRRAQAGGDARDPGRRAPGRESAPPGPRAAPARGFGGGTGGDPPSLPARGSPAELGGIRSLGAQPDLRAPRPWSMTSRALRADGACGVIADASVRGRIILNSRNLAHRQALSAPSPPHTPKAAVDGDRRSRSKPTPSAIAAIGCRDRVEAGEWRSDRWCRNPAEAVRSKTQDPRRFLCLDTRRTAKQPGSRTNRCDRTNRRSVPADSPAARGTAVSRLGGAAPVRLRRGRQGHAKPRPSGVVARR